MKKILMIGYSNTYFRLEFAKNIKDENVSFDILSFDKLEECNKGVYNEVFSCDNKFQGRIHAIIVYLKMLIYIIRIKKYDAIHIHSLKSIECLYSGILRRKCDRLICSMYGSDFYRSSNTVKKRYKKIFDVCDYITITTKKMTKDFNRYYNNEYSHKIMNINMGSTALKNIKDNRGETKEKYKKIFSVPKDSIVCTIGYNATKLQHHKDIIDEIAKVRDKLPNNMFYLIPLGYGDMLYAKDVEGYLKRSELQGRCLYDFYNAEMISKLRLASDIMIQLQDTDMLSGSMLEYLYADNIIITGSWLHYDEISEYIICVDKIGQLSSKMIETVSSHDELLIDMQQKGVYQYIEENFMWKNVKKKWQKLYQ